MNVAKDFNIEDPKPMIIDWEVSKYAINPCFVQNEATKVCLETLRLQQNVLCSALIKFSVGY